MFNKDSFDSFLLITAAIFLGTSSSTYAVAHRTDNELGGNTNHCPGCTTTAFVATLSGGPIWTTAGKNETFFLQPEIQKTYTATRNVKSNGTGEIFVGVQTLLDEGFRGQFGFDAATTGTSIKGVIWDDAKPIFDNFTYQYNVKNTRYTLKTKLLADIPYNLIGYLSASAGVSVNKANNFTITSITSEAVPAPSFNNNSEMSFAYTLGLGAEYPCGEHFQVGIGYEFANWGKTSLSRAPGQSLNNGLGSSHLYTNELLFAVTLIV